MRRSIYLVLAPFLLVGLLSGCASVYTAPDLRSYESAHSKLAVLPFDVTFDSEYMDAKAFATELEQAEIQHGELFQGMLKAELLNAQRRDLSSVEFQSNSETNALLTGALSKPATYKVLSTMKTSEVCKILGVDAVIFGYMKVRRPLESYGGPNLASQLMVGLFGKTKQAHIRLSIHGCEENKIIWKYDHIAKGGLLSSPQSAATAALREAVSAFPYKRN